MVIFIRIFDQVRLDATLGRRDDGVCFVEKVIPVFLDRPENPHLSLFLTDEVLKPHFTAAKDTPRQFRWWFQRVSPDAIGETMKRFASEALREAACRLEPLEPRALADDGWLVHYADWRVLRRWLRWVYRKSGEFRVDASTVAAMVCHVLRHWDLPTALQSFRPAAPVDLFLIRGHETRAPEVRLLHYFPGGVSCLDAAGEPFDSHPPGWYSEPFGVAVDDETIQRILPTAKLERAASQLMRCLSRYPRRGPSIEEELEELDELPSYTMQMFGFYAAQILDYELAAIVEAAGPRRGPAGKQARAVGKSAGPPGRRAGAAGKAPGAAGEPASPAGKAKRGRVVGRPPAF